MSTMTVLSAGPGVTLQDDGRRGYLAAGLSRGGAADRLALAEARALLGQTDAAVLEMAGFGGRFRFDADTRVALTGAPMRVSVDGAALAWNACHLIPEGAVLDIGAVTRGVYGYLGVGGGFDLPVRLGAQSTHLAAGIGAPLTAGETLPIGADRGGAHAVSLPSDDRFGGGVLRVLPSMQTEVFPKEMRQRFEAESFARDSRANRMGVRLLPQGEGYGLDAGGRILSEIITPGDIQIPGDGAPYILMAECQTTGGYPRIGTVIPADLPRVAQAAAADRLQFRFVTREVALDAEKRFRDGIAGLGKRITPLVRDPRTINLLAYDLVSGVTDGEVMR
ncbi:biotin-dependent carboxyltransferase family protein [Sagittula sp. SSi028]|uniref:5-oxoprolinase subunit C family protein n=1 Tax=Sagittula sp. SSi028 TaxID=3400636 RepID=UPI003AF5C832